MRHYHQQVTIRNAGQDAVLDGAVDRAPDRETVLTMARLTALAMVGSAIRGGANRAEVFSIDTGLGVRWLDSHGCQHLRLIEVVECDLTIHPQREEASHVA
jgi:hypothetical protein